MRRQFEIVNVFTRESLGGNPLCVFRDADGWEDDLMQRMARQMNVSESTFVQSSESCDYRVRIFTPAEEIPLAGHPVVGTAFVLDGTENVTFELGTGPVLVERAGPASWRMTQPRAEFVGELPRASVAASLGLSEADLTELTPERVAVGVPFAMVPVKSREALARAEFRPDAWAPIRETTDGLYPFVLEPDDIAYARLLGVAGIGEDPATGSAAGPLAAYLHKHGKLPTARLTVRQGIEIGRPSTIEVDLHAERDDSAPVPRIWGPCVRIGAGYLDV